MITTIRTLLLALIVASNGAAADTLRIAVASNFRKTLETIGRQWTTQTGHHLKISSASTGVLYSQALFGAPFDVLLAADSERPGRLVENGHALADSRVTYALGRLVLAYRDALTGAGEPAVDRLLALPGIRLAVANPALAPYGRAAEEVLARAPLGRQARLLTAANVGQAFQMWHSGGADLALVSAAFHPSPHVPVPAQWHSPIAQQAVILRSSAELALAREFLAFLTSEDSATIIEKDGYLASTAAK